MRILCNVILLIREKCLFFIIDHRRNIIPSEITRGFAYDSDEDSDDERSVTPRVTTPPPQVDMKTRVSFKRIKLFL